MSKQLVYSFAEGFTFDIIQTSIDQLFSEEIVETAVNDTTMELYAAKFIESLICQVIWIESNQSFKNVCNYFTFKFTSW